MRDGSDGRSHSNIDYLRPTVFSPQGKGRAGVATPLLLPVHLSMQCTIDRLIGYDT
jgi:hypothetical protein